MTLVNMCGGCPHNPIRQTTVIGGAEVVPEWMQYVRNTFWNNTELTLKEQGLLVSNPIKDKNLEQTEMLTDGEPTPLKEYMEAVARYQNKDMLYLIGELPVEYRHVFEKMFNTLIERMVEKQITSMPLS